MDRILGSIIDDYTLYKIIESTIAVLLLIIVYLGIQICLKWKYMKREGDAMTKINFTRSAIFIFMTGFFMIIHELLEGLEENAPDFATYEFLELLALIGLALFFYEWLRVLKSIKRDNDDTLENDRLKT